MTGSGNGAVSARRASAATRRDSKTGRLDGPGTISDPRHLTVRIAGAEFRTLTEAAAREGIARSELVRRIIEQWSASLA